MTPLVPRFKLHFLERLAPDYIADSVLDLDIELLKKQKIKAIAFDADSTLVAHGKVQLEPEVLQFLKKISLPVHIATNRLEKGATELARYINADSVTFATTRYRKPQRAYFNKVAVNAGVVSEHIVMVGDRLLTDSYGGNKVGMKTVYVKALGKDAWYMKYTGLRWFENTLVSLLTK